MESGVRARSVPTGGRASMVANPFHSEKVKAEIALSVARPGDFPMKLVAMGILFKMTIRCPNYTVSGQ